MSLIASARNQARRLLLAREAQPIHASRRGPLPAAHRSVTRSSGSATSVAGTERRSPGRPIARWRTVRVAAALPVTGSFIGAGRIGCPYARSQRVLETSPRLDDRYRKRMAELVQYTASDYDESAHKAMIKLDLQDMALPDSSVDVVLTPHVLEHVPGTEQALQRAAPGRCAQWLRSC